MKQLPRWVRSARYSLLLKLYHRLNDALDWTLDEIDRVST